MSEEQLKADAEYLDGWKQHKFMALVGLTILVSLMLVWASLWLYNTSGAAQLDLSRPGYQSVRSQANQKNDFESFAASGPIDKETLDAFRKMYDEQVQKTAEINGFGGDVMSDTALGVGSTPATEQTEQ